MFTVNPFAELSASVSPLVMQIYVAAMFVLVVAGTLFDISHKKSAKYFFENWRNTKKNVRKPVGGGAAVSIAVKTAVVDVAMSGEFCNPRRRIAHLLGMYGFVIYVVTTAIMVFAYPTPATATPAALAMLWYIGALMVCLGGYWFWFFIRVDVAAEGQSPFRFMRADLFIISLVLSCDLRPDLGLGCRRRELMACPTSFWRSISSPPRYCSAQSRGRSSRICSSNPRQHSRRESRRRMGQPRICRRRPETILNNRRDTPWNCCETLQCEWGLASSAKRLATTRRQLAGSNGND